MDTPSKVRSWLAGSMALLLLGLGQSVVAPWAAAEETAEPTPSAEASASASASASPKADPEPTKEESAKPTENPPEAKETPKPKESAKEIVPPKPTPSKSASPSKSAKPKTSVQLAAVPNAAAAKEGKRYDYAGGVSYWVPEQWVVGRDLVISGSGWLNTAQDAGSIIAVKLNDGGISTKEEVKHPVTGVVQGNKTIYAIVQADADGEWTLKLPYPTPDNSTADWSVGENAKVTLLTGSLLTGDVIRSASAESVVSEVPAPTPTPTEQPTKDPTPTPTPTPSQTPTDEPSSPAPTPTTPDCAKPGSGKVEVTPATVELGGVLHVTGSGFCHPAGGGSKIGIKIDAGGFSRLDASVHANKTIWALIDAAEDGTFAIDLQLPDGTEAGQNGSVPAFASGTHTLQFLTGSLRAGDVQRTIPSGAFTVNAAAPEPTPTPTPTETSSPTPTPSPTATPTEATIEAPATVKVGEPIVVSGKGWLHPNGSGSVIGVFLDAKVSGDPNTVYTKRDVINPLTGLVSTDKRQQAVIQAAADGSWTATIPYPTAANARLLDGSWTEWAVGSSHQIRFLTGSLLGGDTVRSVPADFTITGDGPTDPATQPPTWAHDTVTAGGATAWVQSEVATASGSTIKIKGTGWTNQAGTGASTVALKLNYAGGQYARTGGGIVAPTGVADPTIWKLLAPSGTAAHPNVITVPASGNFEIEIDAPEGLKEGQLLTAQFLSGRFGANDTVRNVTTKPLVVGGVPYIEQPDDDDVTCTATSATPVVTIAEPRASLGGTLHVTGAGFCHPGEKRGGSTIAIKIDEGNVSRLNDSLHSNRTIWTIIQAKAADGTFDVELQLPDGTTKGANGSSPAFKEGAHTLRLLTGSLKDGDASRTVLSPEFVVGKYRPTGVPEPVEATEDLTSAARNGVQASRTVKALTVTVPGAKAGDWIYLNTYSGGSPTDPWGATWFRAGADGRVKASLTGVTLPTGTSKLSVQSGNEGEVGKLLGWTPITVAGEKANETPSDTTTTIRTIVRTVTTTTTSASDDSSPTKVPNAPVERASQLTGLSNGDATAKVDGTKLTVTLPKGAADQWVYVYLYSGASIAKAGWVQLTDAKAFSVDLKGLADGRHRVVAVNADGGIVGWVEASKGNVTTATPTTGSPQAPAGPVAPADQGTAALTQPGTGSMEPVLIGAAVAVLAAGLVGLRRLAKPKGVA
ncbi:hypothetical protein [Micropruina sp.]|uniref:hypothetical protein n=1 Tax=Micropruina sp. TaxID=2737536 RepID=UPI0039E277B2